MNFLFNNVEQPYIWVDISTIKPTVTDPVNESLKDTILTEGMLQPLIVREGTEEIMFGNQRYAILKSLNITRVPVRYKETK